MNTTKLKIMIENKGIKTKLFKLLLISFVVLFYFNTNFKYGPKNLFEETIWITIGMILVYVIFKITELIKNKFNKLPYKITQRLRSSSLKNNKNTKDQLFNTFDDTYSRRNKAS